MIVLEVSHKLIAATNNDEVVSNEEIDLTTLMPSNIEEVDGRIFVHVMPAATNNSLILIKTVDIDVVVIAISFLTDQLLKGAMD